MKLICLNLWGGVLYEPLKEFLLDNSDADIFCFQEILSAKSGMKFTKDFRQDFLSELRQMLPDFNDFFSAANDNFGHAIFFRKGLEADSGFEVVHEGKEPVTDPETDLKRILQYCRIGKLAIFNFHGFSSWPKVDTSERISQSGNIIKIMDRFEEKKVLCGDFNVWQDTKSIGMIESRMRNLVRELGISTTRNADFSPDDRISDYAFVSGNIKVKSFSVPDVKVSDHLPLILEFE